MFQRHCFALLRAPPKGHQWEQQCQRQVSEAVPAVSCHRKPQVATSVGPAFSMATSECIGRGDACWVAAMKTSSRSGKRVITWGAATASVNRKRWPSAGAPGAPAATATKTATATTAPGEEQPARAMLSMPWGVRGVQLSIAWGFRAAANASWHCVNSRPGPPAQLRELQPGHVPQKASWQAHVASCPPEFGG